MCSSDLRLLHPAMPFITEELWQRLATDRNTRPVSIAVAHYPQYRQEATDFAAEREIGILQEIVTMARTLRTEAKVDPKMQLEGVLYSRNDAIEMARRQSDPIQKLANIKLEFSGETAPKAPAMRSTAQFDLVLHLPQALAEAHRKRVLREIEQLDKNIANLDRQLNDPAVLQRAPGHVIEDMRKKLVDYREQRGKL